MLDDLLQTCDVTTLWYYRVGWVLLGVFLIVLVFMCLAYGIDCAVASFKRGKNKG